MSSATFTQLITPPASLLPPASQPNFTIPLPSTSAERSETRKPFPVSHLPPELRQLIYTFYFASLPVHSITCSQASPQARLPHHSLTPLFLSSPFLAFDPSPVLFYQNTTFSFSCPEALKAFSNALLASSASEANVGCGDGGSSASVHGDRRKDVRKAKIQYGKYDQPNRDWVYLLISNFVRLKEITFVVCKERGGLGVGHMCFGSWWKCVRDAVRESFCSSKYCEDGEIGRMRGKRTMILRVEDGEWGIEEILTI